MATPPVWVQLTPRGAVEARDRRRFVFDPERLAAAFADDTLKLPIDFDHETEYAMLLGSKPARAWIVAVEARAEGLFGKVEWLPDAVTALAAKAYRYISPTFWRDEDGVTARLLKGAALVSSPALGMPAIASASQTKEAPMLKEILAALGLKEAASLPETLSAITALSMPDPEKFVPAAQHAATVAALSAAQATIDAANQAAQTARCATLVDGAIAAGKLAPAAKDQYLALASAAYDATKAAIDAMPVLLKPGQDPAIPGDPAATAGSLTDAERAIVRNLGVSEADFLAARAAERAA